MDIELKIATERVELLRESIEYWLEGALTSRELATRMRSALMLLEALDE